MGWCPFNASLPPAVGCCVAPCGLPNSNFCPQMLTGWEMCLCPLCLGLCSCAVWVAGPCFQDFVFCASTRYVFFLLAVSAFWAAVLLFSPRIRCHVHNVDGCVSRIWVAFLHVLTVFPLGMFVSGWLDGCFLQLNVWDVVFLLISKQ